MDSRTKEQLEQEITRRKQAEDMLRYQAALLAGLSEAVITTDLGFTIQSWNSAAEALYGWPAQEAIGQWMGHVVPTAYPAHRPEVVLAQFLEEGVWRGQAIQKHRDGSEINVLASVTLIRDDEGRPVSVLAINRDIGELTQAQATLERQKKLSQQYLDVADIMLVVLNREQEVTLINPKGCEVLGYAEEEILGQNWFDRFLFSQDVTAVKQVFDRLVLGDVQAVEYFENPIVRKDGSTRLIAWHNAVLPDASGQITGLLSSGEDITERKQVEDALRESEKRLTDAQRIARMGNFTWDLASGEMTWSEALFDLLGYDRSEQVDYARVIAEIHHPEDMERVTRWLNESIASGQAELEPNEYRVVRRDGEILAVRTMGVIEREDGRATRVFATVQDVTERVQHENRLQASLAEKELLIRELYHRTKNNMQVIHAMLELESTHVDDPRLHRVFLQIESRIQAMALVHEKLYQSQHLSQLDLSEYIRGLGELLWATYQVTPQLVELAFDMEPILTLIDIAVPCGLVVNELVSNALEHAFPDGREGRVRISLRRAGQGELVLVVSDNGVGAPEGFDWAGSGSFGLLAVTSIVEHQLQGQVVFESDGGVTCRISFRDDLYQERL